MNHKVTNRVLHPEWKNRKDIRSSVIVPIFVGNSRRELDVTWIKELKEKPSEKRDFLLIVVLPSYKKCVG
jgi:hypothetical protein